MQDVHFVRDFRQFFANVAQFQGVSQGNYRDSPLGKSKNGVYTSTAFPPFKDTSHIFDHKNVLAKFQK